MQMTNPVYYNWGLKEIVKDMEKRKMFKYYKKIRWQRLEVAVPLGLQFPIYDFIKSTILLKQSVLTKENGEINTMGRYVGGFLTGSAIYTIIYPFDFMRVRRMVRLY